MAQKKRRPARRKPPAKALKAPIRFRIVSLCRQQERTSRELADILEIDHPLASYYLQRLEQERYIRVSKIDHVRGRPRYHYTAIREALLVDEEFAALAPDEKFGVTRSTLEEFQVQFRAARRARTLSARGEHHFSCVDFDLDGEGWGDLMTALSCMLGSAREFEFASSIRLRRTREKPVPAILLLGGFEIPAVREFRENELFEAFFLRSRVALHAGTLDARDDSHLSWIPVLLDEEGWIELADDLRWLRDRAVEIKAESAQRLLRSEEAPVHTNFSAAAFEGPPRGRASVLAAGAA